MKPAKKTSAANSPAPAPAAPVAAPEQMSVNVAVGNVKNVVHAYKGDRNEHNILQESLETIANTLNSNLEDLQAAEARIAELEESETALKAELEALKAELEAQTEQTEPEPEPEPEQAAAPPVLQRHASRFSRTTPPANATPKQ